VSQSGLATSPSGGALPPDVPTSFVTNSGTAIPLANVIEILGAGSATTSGAGNVVTISVTAASFTWNVVTSASNPITLSPGNGYICNGLSTVDFILPASAVVGDTYWIKGRQNLWTLAQNALQVVSLGYVDTTTGTGGSITAAQVKDGIELVCVVANSQWEVITAIGNPIIV
jgi:hypothetical protein